LAIHSYLALRFVVIRLGAKFPFPKRVCRITHTQPLGPNVRKIGKTLLMDSFRSINEGTRHKGLGKPPPIFSAPPKPVGAKIPVIKGAERQLPNPDSRTHGCEKRNHSHHVHQKLKVQHTKKVDMATSCRHRCQMRQAIFLPRCPVSG
jgi:hypothetical protein